jgi:hypothetical protein
VHVLVRSCYCILRLTPLGEAFPEQDKWTFPTSWNFYFPVAVTCLVFVYFSGKCTVLQQGRHCNLQILIMKKKQLIRLNF